MYSDHARSVKRSSTRQRRPSSVPAVVVTRGNGGGRNSTASLSSESEWVLGHPGGGEPLSPVPKRRLSARGRVDREDDDEVVQSSQSPSIVSPVFGRGGGMDVMAEAASRAGGVSFVRTVSVGRDSGGFAEVVDDTEPPEEFFDDDGDDTTQTQTQTQREEWLDGEAISGRGIGGDFDAEVAQTQRTDDEYDDEDGDDVDAGGSDGDEATSSSSSSVSKSVATIPYNDVVLSSLVRHNPPVKFRIMIFDTKSKLMGFFQDHFFGSEDAVDLGVRAADGFLGVNKSIKNHVMKGDLLPLDRINSGSFIYVKTLR